MKKLLILMLVLGLASTVNAVTVAFDANRTATIYESDGTTEYTGADIVIGTDLVIIVDSTQTSYWTGGIYVESGLTYGSLAGRGPMDGTDYTGSHYDAAGDLATAKNYSGAGYDGFDFIADNTIELPNWTTGDWFVIDFECDGEGDVVLKFYDYATSMSVPVGSYTITQIPEPMTIALLGLGGLLLRRRK